MVTASVNRLRYVWHTVRYLQLVQVLYQLRYRVLGASPPRVPDSEKNILDLQVRTPFLRVAAFRDECITFLNAPLQISLGSIDWQSTGQPKLWRYNLHYQDYLRAPGLSVDQQAALIESWIAGNPPGREDAWEAYSISLRVVNWVKAFQEGLELAEPWLDSLFHQLLWLEKNLEYHLLANHLLKNAKALVFGGALFSGEVGARWLRRGVSLMVEQGAEQVLADGGHYERSAMYHCIVLEDYLDAVNLLDANPQLASDGERKALRGVALRAWRYLADILAGDGNIPLFNDAAFGIAPPPGLLLEYGRRVLGLAEESAQPGLPKRICMADSGYFGYRAGGDSLLIDCGPGGPDYQPGHTHADMLSYELCLDGERVVVDSGTFDYEVGPLRSRLRSTAAHNTVVVDGQDQSEVWGAFRVARRARPLFARLGPLENGRLVFAGAHDGYRRLSGRIVHERRITADIGGVWDVSDLISGEGEHRAESFIHLHPDCSVEMVAERHWLVRRLGRPVLEIMAREGASVELRRGVFCPEFGRRHETSVVVLVRAGPLPMELGYRLRKPLDEIPQPAA